MTNVLMRSLVFLLVFLGISNKTSAQGCDHRIKGQVIDATTNEPLPFVQVLVKELLKGAETDENGRYSIDNLCNGNYTIICEHIGCTHFSQMVHVSEEGIIVDIKLHHDEKMLGEVIIKAEAIAAKFTQANSILSGDKLDDRRGEALGEMLKALPGVRALNTGATLSKPMLQGMTGQRVLIFNNGVRLEGQQWGNDHAPELDPFVADKITVVKGASSVVYGADAIGGIILAEPKSFNSDKKLSGEAFLSANSNGKTGIAAVMLEGNIMKWNWRAQGSWKRGGNLQTPNYYLANTGVVEQNFSFLLDKKQEKWKNSFYFSHFHTKIGIFKGSHIGNLEDLKKAFEAKEPSIKADFTYELARPLQDVTHDLLQWKSIFQQSDHRKWQLQISAQRNQRGEFDSHRLFGQLPKELSNPELNFDLWNIASNLFLDHQLRNDIHGKIGVDFNYQNNITKRGGLIPNYVSINNAAFWTERWHRYELPIEVEAGIRYDYKWINVAIPRQDSDTESKLQQFDFQSFAGNFGAIYKFSEQSRLSFNIGNAWRAPNVNELFSYGVHHGTASFEKGDINLKTEVALNNNLSFEWKKEGKWNLQTSIYRNYIQNFIYLEPSKEPVLTIRGAFPAFQYTQANARLTGFDALLEVNLSKNLTLQSKASIIRAKNMTQQNWLILMPADHFENSLRYTFVIKEKTKAYVGCAFQNILKQTRVPENQDYIAPPSAYSLWNGELGIRFEKMSISLQIHNLMNTAYRDYLNRFRYFTDDIGRNISLKVKKSF